MIEIKDLHKAFEENKVLCGINCTISDVDTFVIVGRSGIGKSVLLKCITGLITPDRGEVFIDGESITRASRADLLRLRQKIGMLLQEGALFDSMTVAENVAFPLHYHRIYPPATIEKKVNYFLELVEMADYRDAFPNQLSGGMKRKVAVARAMILEPRYLLYDEPTSGLDPSSAGVVEALILKLRNEMKITSLIVTHDLDLARYVGEHIALLEDGRLTAILVKDQAFGPDSPIFKHFVYNRERVHQQHGYN